MYIEKCLCSCIEQDISPDEYEIIVINDGSEDRTLDIVLEVMKGHQNIEFFSQKNSGLSVTRNRGLTLAKGEYVWFIDSDDYIEKNCLGDICDKLHDIDVLTLGYKQIMGDKIRYFRNTEKKIKDGDDLLNYNIFIPVQLYILSNYFLKKNSLMFFERIFHEDLEFTPRMLYYAKKVVPYDKLVYNKLIRDTSITAVFNSKRAYDLLIVANNLFLFSKNFSNNRKCRYANIVSLVINNALYIIMKFNKNEEEKFVAELFKNKYLFEIMCKSNKLKYKIEGFLFKHFPRNCCTIYKVMKSI
jgi:glycosyltransferase involved in cell wall biosynthesis